ncbi:hypothetical protein PSP31121_04752 [Pandoraea sputorum]|uniref:Tetratricopeptide repeat protein n=2 Tax=Pandoraea sputorum TaxID=93222 RepID=A0A5E5BGL7_9BURK|nr:hypothetical protein PSP31121_04752 [Pandoraea sputorum]
MPDTHDNLDQHEQAADARTAAQTAYREARASFHHAIDTARSAGQPDLAERATQDAGRVALVAAHHFTLNCPYKEAIAAYEEAIALFLQGDAKAHATEAQMQLGALCTRLGRHLDAGNTHRTAMRERRQDPSVSDAALLTAAGDAYERAGQDEEAKAAFGQAGDIHRMLAKTSHRAGPTARANHYGSAGECYVRAELYLKVIEAFRSAAQARSALRQAGNAWERLAANYRERAQLGPAGDAYTRAAQAFEAGGLGPRRREAHTQAGGLYLELARHRAKLKDDDQHAKFARRAGTALRHAEAAVAFQTWTDVYLRQLLAGHPGTHDFTFALRCREVAQSHRAAGELELAKIAEMTAAQAFLEEHHFPSAAEACVRAGATKRAMRAYQQLNEWAGLPRLHPDIFARLPRGIGGGEPRESRARGPRHGRQQSR